MKKVILSVALLSVSLVFAQKKEINNALKAIDGGNNAEALAQIEAADNALNGKIYLLKPSEQEDYYYAKGIALLKSGKTAEGASVLSKIGEMKKVYEGRDNDKNRVYFIGKEQADKEGSGLNLKETAYTPSHLGDISTAVNPILQKAGQEAQTAYNDKNYEVAAQKFLQVTNLLKAVGQPDQTYEYYAAISYTLGKNNEKAVEVYQDLINSGYTGVKTTYSALNKKSNERENFSDKNTFELLKKSSDYADFKEETSKSVENELYQSAASLLIDSEKPAEAVEIIEKGLVKFPSDSRLQDLRILAYSRSGDDEKLAKSVQDAIDKNPNDKANWSNLGVLKSKNLETATEAEKAFKKALEIDPNFKPALQGIVFNLYLNPDRDSEMVDQINQARQDGNNDKANELLTERKGKFELALPYLEKLHQVDPSDFDVARTLASIYHSLGMFDKEDQMKDTLRKLTSEIDS